MSTEAVIVENGNSALIPSLNGVKLGEITSGYLNLRQKLWIRYYLETQHGENAARLAGYKGSRATLRSISSENLTKPAIKAELNRLLNPIADAQEVLQRLTKHSRSSISQVLDKDGSFDLQTAKDQNSDDLIKKLKITRKVRIDAITKERTEEVTHDLELHDAQAATVHLAKVHGLMIDRQQLEQINPRELAEELFSVMKAASERQRFEQAQAVSLIESGE